VEFNGIAAKRHKFSFPSKEDIIETFILEVTNINSLKNFRHIIVRINDCINMKTISITDLWIIILIC
jgi:hypothetical protein